MHACIGMHIDPPPAHHAQATYRMYRRCSVDSSAAPRSSRAAGARVRVACNSVMLCTRFNLTQSLADSAPRPYPFPPDQRKGAISNDKGLRRDRLLSHQGRPRRRWSIRGACTTASRETTSCNGTLSQETTYKQDSQLIVLWGKKYLACSSKDAWRTAGTTEHTPTGELDAAAATLQAHEGALRGASKSSLLCLNSRVQICWPGVHQAGAPATAGCEEEREHQKAPLIFG
jgi:hypothetical protein